MKDKAAGRLLLLELVTRLKGREASNKISDRNLAVICPLLMYVRLELVYFQLVVHVGGSSWRHILEVPVGGCRWWFQFER